MKKIERYVAKCIKSNRNLYAFGSFHKKGQYVMYSGKGTYDIQLAYIYGDKNEWPLVDDEECKEYYELVPIVILELKIS